MDGINGWPIQMLLGGENNSKQSDEIQANFDPDLMGTYQKQYGKRLVRLLVCHQVEESWFRQLSQIYHSAYVLMLMLMC